MQQPRFVIRQDVIDWARRHMPISEPDYEHRVPIDFVVAHCAAAHGVTIEAMLAQNRSPRTTLIRQIAMYLCRKSTTASSLDIAQICKRRDHSTVLYAERRISGMAKEDPLFESWINDLEATITASYKQFREERRKLRTLEDGKPSSSAA